MTKQKKKTSCLSLPSFSQSNNDLLKLIKHTQLSNIFELNSILPGYDEEYQSNLEQRRCSKGG